MSGNKPGAGRGIVRKRRLKMLIKEGEKPAHIASSNDEETDLPQKTLRRDKK
jgi:hypothetical protein